MSDTYKVLGYEIKKEWSELASQIYVLYKRTKIRGQCETHHIPMFRKAYTTISYGDWRTHTYAIAEGDESWAKKTAKHYGIELP